MKTLRIGIASYDQMKARTMAIARGEHKPARDEPKVWFTSMESIAKVLSGRNRDLLALIARREPASLTELAELSGREKSNLSRTLKTMSRYGLVELTEGPRGTLCPRTPFDHVSVRISLTSGQAQTHGSSCEEPVLKSLHDANSRAGVDPAERGKSVPAGAGAKSK
ncbi:MAG: MarR family transcriptional regulator [Rhodobacteraceae bacterium]|nr:MarR family transcriptional regulator [Paracoccaceae bacterium]MCY4140202.1 MarR family transcriptional regulator [Paracoccaceae bacterium]